MKARAPPFERDPGVPAEGVPPRRQCRAPTRPRTSALYGAEAPSGRARAPRARDCMPARASTCDDTYIFAAVQFALPSSGARRRRGAALRADRRQPTHPPSTVPLQGHRGITRLPTRRPVVPRVVPLTCDFNMIKNYTHDWLLLVAAYHASSRRWGALAPQRKTRRFTGDREFGVATAPRCCMCPLTNAQRRSQRR